MFKNVALCGKYVQVGDIYVYTQNQVGDYTIYPYDRLNQIAHNNNVVVSGHRVEYTQRTSCQSKFVATCGCLCDPHVYRPIKYKKYETGKQSMNYEMAGSAAYNKKMEFSKHWEKGFIIIDSKQNKTKITQHEIKFSEEFKQYATNVNYKIYTSDGQNYLPTKSTLVLADIHAPAYNIDALNRVDQYVKNRPVKFDNLILLGDTADCRFVNPHEMQKTRCANENALVEFESYEKILKRFEHYCDKKYIMFGNHEDFINRWTDSHKQFKDLFEKLYTDPISKYGYTYIKDKDFINIDNVIYSHGDMKCFGASGSNLQKHLKTLGGEYPVVIGHSHRPQKYQNGTSVPSLCDLNQQYNEVNASNWKNGFTVVNSYGDLRFVSMHLF